MDDTLDDSSIYLEVVDDDAARSRANRPVPALPSSDNFDNIHYSTNNETITPVQATTEITKQPKIMKYALIAGICFIVFICVLLICLVAFLSKPSNPEPIDEKGSSTLSTSVVPAPTRKSSKHTNVLPINFINIWNDGAIDNSGFIKYSYMCHSDKPSQDEFINFNWKISDNLVSAQTAKNFTSKGQTYTVILQKTATKYLCCFVFQVAMFTKCTEVKPEPKTPTATASIVTKTSRMPITATTQRRRTATTTTTTPAAATTTTKSITTITTTKTTTKGRTIFPDFVNIWLDSAQNAHKFNYGFVKYSFICHSDKPPQDKYIIFNWKISDNFTVANTPQDFIASGQTYKTIIQKRLTKYLCCFGTIYKKTISSCIKATPEMIKLSAIRVFTTQRRIGRTGIIQSLKINETGCYQLELLGASGGNHNSHRGGRGAKVITKEKIYQNTVLRIVVGQQGRNASFSGYGGFGGGGGGGTFVYSSSNTLFAAAGGGGGAGYNSDNNKENGNGRSSTNGAGNQCQSIGSTGGSTGYGGRTYGGTYRAGSGAGWNSKGNNGYCYSYSSPGGETRSSYSSSWSGAQCGYSSARYHTNGGFGGGGSGGCYYRYSSSSYAVGGGGGGYSGGSGGQYPCSPKQGGGGGGSYCRTAASCTKITGGNTDQRDGQLIIMGILNC